MASDIDFYYATSGLTTLYAVAAVGTDMVHASTGALQPRTSGNWSSSAIAISDALAAYHYVGALPGDTVANRHLVRIYRKAGASAAITDPMVGGPAVLDWDGTAEIVGANVTHGDFEPVEPDTTLADNINAVLGQFATGNVYLIRAYLNGSLEIRRGDSYGTAAGQRLTVTKPAGAQWPADLTTWTITFSAEKRSGNRATGESTLGPITCVHGTETGDSQTFYIDLTHADTDGLALGAWDFDVQAAKGSDRNTLISGPMRVVPEYTTT